MIDVDPSLAPEKQARAKFLLDTAELMALPCFRRWAWHLIEDGSWCAAFGHGADTKDPNAMYFALGRREVGSLLMQLLMGVGADKYKQMLTEAISLKVQRDTAYEAEMKKRGE